MNKTSQQESRVVSEAIPDYSYVEDLYDELYDSHYELCKAVYMNYHVSQLAGLPKCIQNVWHEGSKLYNNTTRGKL